MSTPLREGLQTIETIPAMRAAAADWRRGGATIGLVPTMGYLHEGHLSLVRAARDGCDRVVVSLFVNPTQFGPGEDLERYPRDLERDVALCREAGVDALFHPASDEMYPSGAPLTSVTVKGVTEGLCGRTRPTHFSGVATVVTKLLNIVAPDRAYFGEKDYQQLVVVRTMVRDLDIPVGIIGCPIVREPDGLAMSSRNTMLSHEQRQQATVLYQALCAGRRMCEADELSADAVREAMVTALESAPLARIDYVEVVDLDTLAPVTTLADGALLAVAVRFGDTRLIDNMVVRPPASSGAA